MPDRWAFEALARLLGLDGHAAALAPWSAALAGGVAGHVAILLFITVGVTTATVVALARHR